MPKILRFATATALTILQNPICFLLVAVDTCVLLHHVTEGALLCKEPTVYIALATINFVVLFSTSTIAKKLVQQ